MALIFGDLTGKSVCASKCTGRVFDFMMGGCGGDEESDDCGTTLSSSCCELLSNFYGAGCNIDTVSDEMDADGFDFGTGLSALDAESSYTTKYEESMYGVNNFDTIQAACEASYPEDDDCNSTAMGAFYNAQCSTPVVTATLNFALSSDGNIAISDEEATQIAEGLIPTVSDALGANESDVEVSNATYTAATTKASSGTLSAEFKIKAASSSVTAASVKTALEAVPAANYTAAILASNVAGVPADVGVVATADVEVTAMQSATSSGSGFNTFSIAFFALVAAMFW
jgi:hypothetical protein